MPDRRSVGQRRRASDDSESRVSAAIQRAREKVSRESGGRKGIDARAHGDDREAVDAAEAEIDEEAVEAVGGGPSKTRLQLAREEAAGRIRELTALQKERLKDQDTRALLEGALGAIAVANDGSPDMDTGSDNVGTRAAESAAISSPMGRGGLRPVGDERVVSEMARSSAAESNQLLDFGDDGLGMGAGASIGVSAGSDGGTIGLDVGGGLLSSSETSDSDSSNGSNDSSALDVGLSNNGGLL